jgi:hypothetical protein
MAAATTITVTTKLTATELNQSKPCAENSAWGFPSFNTGMIVISTLSEAEGRRICAEVEKPALSEVERDPRMYGSDTRSASV